MLKEHNILRNSNTLRCGVITQNLFVRKHNQEGHILQIVRITLNVHGLENEQNKHSQKCINVCIVLQFGTNRNMEMGFEVLENGDG